MVEHLVQIELAYINTKHPDFHEATLMQKALATGEFDKTFEKLSNPNASVSTHSNNQSLLNSQHVALKQNIASNENSFIQYYTSTFI